MESCNICCFPYSDTTSDGTNHVRKELDCNHSMCHSCYLRLEKTQCPFCRSIFKYSKEELDERNSLNLSYHQWQPPSQILNYIPPDNVRTRQRTRNRNNTSLNINMSNVRRNEIIIQEPYSRVRKNMVRNKRRNLDFEEVLERRKIIKKRCKKKWTRKNARAEKEISYFTAGMCVY